MKKIRGYIDGCFDLMHSGHYNAIRQAKQVCDYLIVGIHSDSEIELNKAAPVMRQAERYELLKHIKWIDEIIYEVPYSPTLELLAEHDIDYVIHGDDLPVNAEGKGAYDAIFAVNKMKIVKRTEGVSTTDIVGRMLMLNSDHLRRGDDCMLTTTRRISEFSSRRTPTADDKVVYVDGGFDMFHVGHASTLKAAKEIGSYLIVGVFTDAVVNKQKGGNYPIMNLHERLLNVLACKWVDEVLIGAPEDITEHLIKTLNIAIVAQGTASGTEALVVQSTEASNELPKRLGIYRSIDSKWPLLNVTEIANRVIENRQIYLQRNAKKASLEQEFYKNRAPITEK